MGKIKQTLKKISKTQWSILAVVVVVVIGAVVYQSNKKVDITKDLTVSFSGYNGMGTVAVDSTELQNEIVQVYADKLNLSESETKALQESSSSSADIDTADRDKMMRWIKGLSFKFSKENGLSNGDKVTLTVKSSEKDSPIKDTEKTYTVKGLEKGSVSDALFGD